MIRRFLVNRTGSAATEFALSLPMMMVLMFGGLEAGHFFWTEHKLVKAVRDGARYAARLDVHSLCNGATDVMSTTVEGDIQAVTSTGLPTTANAAPKVPGWSADGVDVTVVCEGFLATGIYEQLGNAGPIVTVSSGAVTYPSLFEALGVITSSFNISAESSAAVTGL